MSALSRVAVDNHKHLSIERGDTVVLSSRIIPGNEKGIYRMINHFAKRGADVIYGTMNPPMHVSGHASAEELKLVLNLVRPNYFMPVHGEYRQLAKHAQLAQHLRSSGLKDTFVLETGDTLEIDQHGARKGDRVPVGRVCIDSGTLDDSRRGYRDPRPPAPLRGRLRAADHRHQQALRTERRLAGNREPRLHQRGRHPSCSRKRATWWRGPSTCSTEDERADWGVMQEKIRTDLRRFLIKQTSRHPLIMPVILET